MKKSIFLLIAFIFTAAFILSGCTPRQSGQNDTQQTPILESAAPTTNMQEAKAVPELPITTQIEDRLPDYVEAESAAGELPDTNDEQEPDSAEYSEEAAILDAAIADEIKEKTEAVTNLEESMEQNQPEALLTESEADNHSTSESCTPPIPETEPEISSGITSGNSGNGWQPPPGIGWEPPADGVPVVISGNELDENGDPIPWSAPTEDEPRYGNFG